MKYKKMRSIQKNQGVLQPMYWRSLLKIISGLIAEWPLILITKVSELNK